MGEPKPIAIAPDERTEILFYKSLGLATTNPSSSVTQQNPANAGMKIIPDLHIFKQKIPLVAPDESDLIDDLTFQGHPVTPEGTPACRRRYSSTYPWVVKYENLPLVTVTYTRCFNAVYPVGNLLPQNLLSQTIPFNYDTEQSYAIAVSIYTEDAWIEIPPDSDFLPWYYDNAAGFVTFYDRNTDPVFSSGNTPIMTFWRYEGEFGLSSDGATGGSTGSGATGPTGYAGPAGPTGSPGVTGPAGYTGAKGDSGEAANTGATGDIGPTGYTGAKGDSGEAANTGATGPTGPVSGVDGTKIHLGDGAGQTYQMDYAVAIGYNAGNNSQGGAAVAIGTNAGRVNQGTYSIAIGYRAGIIDQPANSIVLDATGVNDLVPTGSGFFVAPVTSTESTDNIMVYNTLTGEIQYTISNVGGGGGGGGGGVQGTSVFLGDNAGQIAQGDYSVAIGNHAGQDNQGYGVVAIGDHAGQNNQGDSAVAIGYYAGQHTQGNCSLAIGDDAGSYYQGYNSVALGRSAGGGDQGNSAVAIGCYAGNNSQGGSAVAIGDTAGSVLQGINAVAMGYCAGQYYQGTYAVAIGNLAGNLFQGTNAIAIGNNAGYENQSANSIVLNASGDTLNATDSGFFVKPLRTGGTANMSYNSETGEITVASSSRTTKNTIEDLTMETSGLHDLKPKTFIYNSDSGSGKQVGYIAEEVADINKHFATYNKPDGPPVAINWNTISVFLVEEMKKLKRENENLKQAYDELAVRVTALE